MDIKVILAWISVTIIAFTSCHKLCNPSNYHSLNRRSSDNITRCGQRYGRGHNMV